MARTKKNNNEIIETEEILEETVKVEEEVKTEEIIEEKTTSIPVTNTMFCIVCTGKAILRRKPTPSNVNTNIAGQMQKGKVYSVVSTTEIGNYKYYKLDNGYYVLSDVNVKIV